MFEWLDKNWFLAVQTFGIMASFCLAAFAAFRSEKSRRISNYLQLTEFHRDIWSMTMTDPNLNRIRSKDQNLWTDKISDKEKQFLTFILLHVTCSYELAKNNEILQVEGMKDDINDLLGFPMVRRFWEENKRLYNDDFVKFVESCAPTINMFQLQINAGQDQKTILVASAFPEKIIGALSRYPDRIIFATDEGRDITGEYIEENGIDFIVAFGYGKLFKQDTISATKIINLHGGYLPWNRGPNPNLWSWIDNTPKGVTIHEIDVGVDTGPILAQREVMMTEDETLASSFDKVVQALADLFHEKWDDLRNGTLIPKQQPTGGSAHTFKDQEPFQYILDEGLHRKIGHLLVDVRAVLEKTTNQLVAR